MKNNKEILVLVLYLVLIYFVLKRDTAKLQNRNQEIASMRVSGNEINQKKFFLKVCTDQNKFIEMKTYHVHQSMKHLKNVIQQRIRRLSTTNPS